MRKAGIIIKHIFALVTVILLSIVIHLFPFHSTNYIVLTPGNQSKVIEFDLNNFNIEKLEVIVSARLVPYNHLADYFGPLEIRINGGRLPSNGDFGLPHIMYEFFERKGSISQNILEKILWYAPNYYKASMGLSGIRTVWFNEADLRYGLNILSITSCDNGSGPSLGDAFIIKNVIIRSHNEIEDRIDIVFALN